MLPEDIIAEIRNNFGNDAVAAFSEKLAAATDTVRVQRCIAFAARSHMWYFDYLCRLAKIDYRDVIVAAEYGHQDERLYDFNKPIPEAIINVDRHPSEDVLRKS